MTRGTKRRQNSAASKNASTKNVGKAKVERRSTSQPPRTPTSSDTSLIKKAGDSIISPRSEVAVEMQRSLHISHDQSGLNMAHKKLKPDPIEPTKADLLAQDDQKATQILLSNFNSLKSGQLLSIGTGIAGQLGLGPDISERKKPYPVKELINEKIKIIAAGGMHSAVLTADHKIYTFGCNDEGALGRTCSDEDEEFVPDLVVLPEDAGRPVMLTAGDSHCATLDEFGKVFVWGNFRDGSGVLGLQNHKTKQVKPLKLDLDEFVVKIASGTDHLVLLSRHGVAFTFGSGGCGQLGRGGRYFSDRGGRRGTEYVLKPAPVRFSVSRNKKVFNGDTTSYLDASGFPSPSGFTKPHSNKTFVEDIFAAGMATFIVCAGQVYSFGLNNYKQLGLGDKENRFAPTLSEEYSKHRWLQIVGGEHHCLALSTSRQAFGIGRGDNGRLGVLNAEGEVIEETSDLQRIKFPFESDADMQDTNNPTHDNNDPNMTPSKSTNALKNLPETYIQSISSKGSIGYAINNQGEGYSWGFGENLQLSTGEEDDENTPTKLMGGRIEGKELIAVAAGDQHGLMLIHFEEE